MTEQQFEARWKQNQEQRHAEGKAVEAKWDQADALLLIESGWTQERIAAKVGKSQQWVDYQLRFGRFLNYNRGCNTLPDAPAASLSPNLTERAFRDAWSQAPKRTAEGVKHPETERFELVREILEAKFILDPLGVGTRSKGARVSEKVATLADAGWLTKEQALADLEESGIDEKQLAGALDSIKKYNRCNCMVEEKTVKGQDLFRVRKLDVKPQIKSEKVIHFYEEAMPLLKEAKSLTDRPVIQVSMQSILHKLILLERLIKGLHEELGTE